MSERIPAARSAATGDVPEGPVQLRDRARTPKWAGAARVALLAGSDCAALFLAGMLAFLLWAQPVRNQDASLYLSVAPVLSLLVLGYAQAGLYPGFGLGPVEILRRYFLVTTSAFLALAALTFALKVPETYSRVTVALALVFSIVLVAALRWLVQRIARRWYWWPEPVLLVTDGRRPDLLRRLVAERPSGEFRPAATLTTPPSGELRPGTVATLEAAQHYARVGIRVAFADLRGPSAEVALENLRLLFPRVIILRDFEELPVEGVQVRNLGGVLGLEYGNNLLLRQSRWVKRALDIGLGSLALLLALPVIGIAAAAVKLASPGPALFWQPREGRRSRTIYVPKIRTMVIGADERVEYLLRTRADLRSQWEAGFKLRDDPRIIPRVGVLLRRFSVDELPQLWSVLRGDMSLVGPRPFPHYHLAALSAQARELRGEVRPGITGLWQVTSRGVAGVEAQQAYDIYYIRNWSLWLDLYILARTVSAVITGRGAS